MKTTPMILIYKSILAKTTENVLEEQYSKSYASNAIKLTDNEFDGMLKRVPDVGGKENPFFPVYVVGIYIISLYKVLKEAGVSLEEMENILQSGLQNLDVLKKLYKNQDLTSPEYKLKMIKASQWCLLHNEDYPENWLFEIQETKEPSQRKVKFTRCPLIEIAKDEGVAKFAPLLCKIDYMLVVFSGLELKRPKTLGKGDDCCSFTIQKPSPQSEEA